MDKLSPEILSLIETMYLPGSDRRAALKTLIDLDSVESTLALMQLAEDYHVPPFYIDILHELGQRGMIDAMRHFEEIILSDSDVPTLPGNQLSVIDTLSKYPDNTEAFELIRYTLKHHNRRAILRQCVYTLGQIGNDEAIYILSLLMQEFPEPSVRHDSVMVLGSTGNPRAIPILLGYLEAEHPLHNGERLPTNCVNAMNSLLRLWNADVQPFNVSRWLGVLTFWLYQDVDDYPSALYVLKKLDLPEAKVIIHQWEETKKLAHYNHFFV